MSGYQVMPRLTPDEYADLESDIVAHGVQVPITVDRGGVIVDGHHRDEIARKHDLHCPRVTANGTDEELRGLAFSLNLNRRHLNREQRRGLIAESLRSDPELSNREHARRTGVTDKTVRSVRDDLVESAEIPHFAERVDPRTGNLSQAAERPRATAIPQSDLDALNEDTTPVPEEDESAPLPEWENVAQLSPAATEAVKREKESRTPRPESIPSQFTSAISDLNRVMNRIGKISEDKNFHRNKETVAIRHLSDITRTISELKSLADQLS